MKLLLFVYSFFFTTILKPSFSFSSARLNTVRKLDREVISTTSFIRLTQKRQLPLEAATTNNTGDENDNTENDQRKEVLKNLTRQRLLNRGGITSGTRMSGSKSALKRTHTSVGELKGQNRRKIERSGYSTLLKGQALSSIQRKNLNTEDENEDKTNTNNND